MTKQIRRSIPLSQEQWENLDQICKQVGAVATGGPKEHVGRHTWRALIRMIADGELEVTRPNQGLWLAVGQM